MNVEEAALSRVVRALEHEKVAYMVTGSFASSYHGRPRSTHDADIVIDPDSSQLARFVRLLAQDGFFVDADRAADSLRRRLQFNAIDIETGWKIDLILRKDRPFSKEELRRRQTARLSEDTPVTMASPEDTILSKLEWARKAGGSEKQLADARGVVEVHRDLDRAYIEKWAVELGVSDLWKQVSGTT